MLCLIRRNQTLRLIINRNRHLALRKHAVYFIWRVTVRRVTVRPPFLLSFFVLDVLCRYRVLLKCNLACFLHFETISWPDFFLRLQPFGRHILGHQKDSKYYVTCGMYISLKWLKRRNMSGETGNQKGFNWSKECTEKCQSLCLS